MPSLAIPVAQRLWPGEDDHSILLTPEEHSQWRQIYSHPERALWWFRNYWWSVDDRPAPSSQLDGQDLDNETASKRWVTGLLAKLGLEKKVYLVKSGVQWGPLAGGEDVELWSWNGRNCKFNGKIGCLQF
jgi:hypothetical protein